MLVAFARAVAQFSDPRFRRVLWRSVAWAAALLVGLVAVAILALRAVTVFETPWIDGTVTAFGGLAAVVIAAVLFPAATLLLIGIWLDEAAAVVEARHYPGLPPPRRLGVAESLASAGRLAILGLVLNLAVLPLYLVPVANVFLYSGLNGYLVAREYFEQVALRRLDRGQVATAWRRHRLRLWMAGAAIALVFAVPVANLAGPLLGTAVMVHLVEGLRRRGRLAPGGRPEPAPSGSGGQL